MKVYVLYESFYGDLVGETGDCTSLIGVYNDINKAKQKANNYINSDLQCDYVLDDEKKDINENMVRLFYSYQENWECFYEIIIEEREVE